MTKQRPSKQTVQVTAPQTHPNAALVSLQIEAIQVVLRRMRASKSLTLDPITHEKLDKIADQ